MGRHRPLVAGRPSPEEMRPERTIGPRAATEQRAPVWSAGRFPAVKIRIATVLALLAALACAGAAPAGAIKPGPKDPKRCNGMAQLCERTLDQVVLPAAHNAMSAQSLGFQFPNQTLSIPEQLDYGIRGLLIDTHYGRLQPDGTVITDDGGSISSGVRGTYLCHELCEIGASKLAPTLRQIRKWVRANPTEVLLIENEDYVGNADLVSAMKRSGLLDYVYKGPRSPWPTLAKMIRKNHRVVMLADNDKAIDPAWYRPTYEGLMQETPYTFNPPSKLTDPANWPDSCQPNRGGLGGSLFLMNHWSPSIAPPTPNPEQSAAVYATEVLVGRATRCAEIRGRYPNIIAADQVTTGGLLDAVRRLNSLPAGEINP